MNKLTQNNGWILKKHHSPAFYQNQIYDSTNRNFLQSFLFMNSLKLFQSFIPNPKRFTHPSIFFCTGKNGLTGLSSLFFL